MPIRVNQIILPLDHGDGAPEDAALAACGLRAAQARSVRVRRRSIDARRGREARLVYQVEILLAQAERTIAQGARSPDVVYVESLDDALEPGAEPLAGPVLVIGAGPCGLFAAYRLAQYGYKPVVLERGRDARSRLEDLRRFRLSGILSRESNLLFGEGGAGMYSDGKLATRVSSPLIDEVLDIFHAAGAPDSIRVEARPHIGSNLLPRVLRKLRGRLVEMGATFRFQTRVVDVEIAGGALAAVRVDASDSSEGPERPERIVCGAAILAVGGSARDVFELLLARGVALEPRPTLMGVRIEHPQELIDRNQYGAAWGSERLGHAEYFITTGPRGRASSRRPVHSFCMCPGGEVIAIATETGGVSANGMSNYSRESGWANSAFIAPIEVADYGASAEYGADSPLAGVACQRSLERAVFLAGGGDYSLPAQRALDFHRGRASVDLPPGPRVTRRKLAAVHELVPEPIAASIRAALSQADQKIPGFLSADATVYGLEIRTGSPVRIVRGESGESISTARLYPAGEGAGYAGGIMTAAIDGMEQAARIVTRYAPPLLA